MTSEQLPTPVVAVEGQPCMVGGQAGRTHLMFALVRRGPLTTLLALEPDHLTIAGDMTWVTTSCGTKPAAGDVRAVFVRQDWLRHRGIGLGMRYAARELTEVTAWTGAAIPDSSDTDSQLESPTATGGQQTVPIVDLPDAPIGAEAHVVLHRAGRAVIVAFSACLVRVGHLAWTISRPGGRVGGDQAGIAVGEVQRVDTRTGHSRQGIATRLYHRALRVAAGRSGWPAEIDHNQDRTQQGDGWAKKVGGYRPPLARGQHVNEEERLMRFFG